MIEVSRLSPHDMGERDKLALIKFSEWDYNRRSPSDMIQGVLEGAFQMWRVSEGEGSGLLITKVLATVGGGRTLYVEGIAGTGFVKKPKEMVKLLFDLARRGRCQSVTGWVSRPGMEKWLEQAELPLVASVFMKEIPAESEVPSAPQELAQSPD